MQCDICLQTGGPKLPFLCPTDARNQLYEPRIQHAQMLLEKDALDREISALLTSRPPDGEGGSNETEILRPHVDKITAEKEQAEDRTQQIIAHADELRANIDKAREEIARRKAAISRRKTEREAAENGLEARRVRQTEEVEKAVRMTRYKWNQAHSITASSRAFLCGEAARLYGLRRVRRGSGSDEYRVGGVGIVDLLAMNTASPAQISTSLSHVVHLLILSTHYLAIRLPAEITLPHRDYPLPTVFPLLSSYKHENVPFPAATTLSAQEQQQQQADVPSPSQEEQQQSQPKQPRPRPLFVTKPLPMLAAEDPAGHALFLEGATLLAYDVAWLCRSQGVPVGENGNGGSFEDVCNIGRNMFNLLVASQGRGPGSSNNSSRAPSTRTTPTKGTRGEGDAEEREREKDRKPSTTLMGRYSHGTAHSNLGSSAGAEFTRGFKIISPTKLADRLKARLASEVANAEWELLDPDAWAMEDEAEQEQRQHEGLGDGDDGIVVGARREGADAAFGGYGAASVRRAYGYGMQSFMSMRTVMDAVEVIGGGGERRPGTSGWTKLKPR